MNRSFYRLPTCSPHLNVIERFWKLLRRRATHNRLFDSLVSGFLNEDLRPARAGLSAWLASTPQVRSETIASWDRTGVSSSTQGI